MQYYQSASQKSNSRTALTGVLVWMVLVMISGAAWAAGPSPLPLDPANLPAGTEAFVSQTQATQLRGVGDSGTPGDPSGLNFQNIGGPAGIEYNNIAYDPETGYIYAVSITGTGSATGGNLGLVRIGLNPANTSQLLVQELGWPGYDSNQADNNPIEPWGDQGTRFPRYDAGDIDPDKREFYVMVTATGLGSGCTSASANLSTCLGRVIAFDIDMLPAPGADPENLTAAFSDSKVFTATPGGTAITGTIAGGRVADWAFKDGKLYGGNAETGQLAVITPNVGREAADPRPVFQNFNFDGSGLDTTTAVEADAYGAAWFIDDILYLYRNGGNAEGTPKVFKIDLQINPTTGDPTPIIIEVVENVDMVTRNDGASFMAQGPVAFECTGEPFIIFGNPSEGQPSEVNQVELNPGATPGFLFGTTIDPTGDTQINNLGFRSTDGLLYGWERLTSPDDAGRIITIDSAGTVIDLGNPGLPANQRPFECTTNCEVFNYNAGDVSVDGTEMYLSYSVNNGDGGPLYIVDLTTVPPTLIGGSAVTISGDTGQVADWAAHPTNGLLYGGDHTNSADGNLAELDPATGIRTDVTVIGLADPAGNQGFGAAWFDASGRLYLYDNNGIIYAIDDVTGTPTLVGGDYPLENAALTTTNNDGANCAAVTDPAPAIEIQKTVYWDHDDGASAPGGELVIGENNDLVTYVFTVTNTGNTYLGDITIADPDLNISRSNLDLLSGSEPLAPNDSLVFYYEAFIDGDLVNTASTSGNPVEENGDDIPDLQDPMDDDTAQVQEAASGIDIQKTVYAGHDSGISAPGDELVIGADGSEVTYVFVVTNTGETYLDDITIDDDLLGGGITEAVMTLYSGNDAAPLAPGGQLVFYYETTITVDLLNTATTSGNPVDDQGADLPGFENPMASDTAEVNKAEPAIQIQKTVYADHDSGDSAPGQELVTAPNGSDVTYVFTVTNTGNTYLDDITIADTTLDPNITRYDLTMIQAMSDPEPLAPDGKLVFYYDAFIDDDLTNTASISGNPVEENGEDIPGLEDPTDDDTARVEILTAQVSVLKLTDGNPDPNSGWMFAVYVGPNASNGSSFLASPLASESTAGAEDGVLEFATELDITATYTLCELGLPGGWSSTWMIGTGDDSSADMYIMPYNPNVSDPEDLGNDCFDFGADTDYPLEADSVLAFEVDNISPPGGQARTPGYWKNWNTCSTGNQPQTAAKNGGPDEGWFLMDDILTSSGVTWGSFTIKDCEDGVSILDQRELSGRGKKKASDAAYTLAMHLLAYQLNDAAGAYDCPQAGDAAVAAENLLISIGFDGEGSYLRPKDVEYQQALDLAETLDAYNNNMLCN